MRHLKRRIWMLVVIACIASLGACATLPEGKVVEHDKKDVHEGTFDILK